MKGKRCLLTIVLIMMALFSSATYASIMDFESGKGEWMKYPIDFNDKPKEKKRSMTLSFDGDWDKNPAEIWVKILFGPKYGKGGSWGNWGEYHGHPKPDCDPPSVPLPSALWLFGSVILGLSSVRRKPNLSRVS